MRDLESATYCPLFLPKENDIVKEMHDVGQSFQRAGNKAPRKNREEVHTSGSSWQC